MPISARPTVTLRDVAAAAGVSVSTASRVLGGSDRTVAEEYRQRVFSAAAALRYTADASARAMRRANDSIAVIGDATLTTPSMGMVAAAMERQARDAGAFVTVSSTHGTAERQLETVRLQRALRPRALILTSSRLGTNALGGRLLDELLGYEREGGPGRRPSATPICRSTPSASTTRPCARVGRRRRRGRGTGTRRSSPWGGGRGTSPPVPRASWPGSATAAS